MKNFLLLFVLCVFTSFSLYAATEVVFEKKQTFDLGNQFSVKDISYIKKPGALSDKFDYYLKANVSNQSTKSCDALILLASFLDKDQKTLQNDLAIVLRNIKSKQTQSFEQKIVSVKPFQKNVTDVKIEFGKCNQNLNKSISCREKCMQECQKKGRSAKECLFANDPKVNQEVKSCTQDCMK